MSKKSSHPTGINWTRVIIVTIRGLSAIATVAIITYGG
jgi:hypothetical protein